MTSLLLLVMAAWPAPDSVLTAPQLPPRAAPKRLKVVIDAGHGAPNNGGNHGCYCQLEADTTLEEARRLAAELAQAGPFEVRLARENGAPLYAERLQAAEAWKADAVLSLHTDARGWAPAWEPWDDGRICYRNDLEPGFSVLWSEEGPKAMVEARARLGRAVSLRMREAGFGPYEGVKYGGLYREDGEPGGWIDIHAPGKRIYFLRASTQVPVVIIETHHALDAAEVQQWSRPQTQHVFAMAVAAALLDFAGPEPVQDAGAQAR